MRRNLVLLVATLTLLLGLGELAVRLLGLAPAVDAEGFVVPPREFEWDRTSNARGWHDVEHAAGPRPGVFRILVVGDSYVEARHVPLEATFFRRLEARLLARGADSVEVIAIGRRGWSQREELPAFLGEGLSYRPDLVLLAFLGFNDVAGNEPRLAARVKEQEESLAMRRPGQARVPLSSLKGLLVPASHLNRLLALRLTLLGATWSGALARGADSEATIPLDYFVYAARPDTAWDRAWGETAALLARFRDAARAAGARLLVVSLTMPQGFSDGGLAELRKAYPAMRRLEFDLARPDSILGTIASRDSIPVCFLAPAFRARYARDRRALHFAVNGHWNEAGHELAAETIAESLQAGGWLGAAGGAR